MTSPKKIVLVVLLFSCFFGSAGPDDSLKISALRARVKSVASTDPASTDKDLAFLLETLKGKEIVAMGEATHGSKEFFTLKHRVFKLLCENGGTKIFGLEESYAAGLLVNDFINARTDMKAMDVVMKMSFMWRTKEMKDMIEWMRSYNDDPQNKEKITFFGFDFHGPHHAVKYLYTYFENMDTVYLRKIKPFLKKFEDKTYPKDKIGDKELKESYAQIKSIRENLKMNRAKYEAIAGARRWMETDHILECLYQYMDTYKSGNVDFFKRDPYMSANVKWIYEQEGGKKMMLWAHNEHVCSGGSLPFMGKLIKLEFGDRFYSIGFVFNEGEYTGTKQYKCSALEAGVFSFAPAPSGSFSDLLRATGVTNGFLDMNSSGMDEKMAAWFKGSHKVYEVGYRGFDNMKKLLLKKRKLSEIYNAVFFVSRMTNTDHYLFGPNKNSAVYFNPFPTN